MANILGRLILNNIEILELDNNPGILGVSAATGSFALYNGNMYVKYASGNFSWRSCVVTENNNYVDYKFPNIQGENNQLLATDGNSNLKWVNKSVIENENNILFFDDFIVSTQSKFNWGITTNGAGSAINIFNSSTYNTPTNKFLGSVGLNSGTNPNGRATLHCGINTTGNSILFGFMELDLEIRLAVQTLANVTDDFDCYVGFINQTGAGENTNGAYFEYDRGNSNNWRIVTANSSTRTKNTTTNLVSTNPVKLRINVNNTANNISYFIDDNNVGNITTNIPTNPIGFGIKIEKNSGTTNRLILVDYVKLRIIKNG